jgi:hypothetical protein
MDPTKTPETDLEGFQEQGGYAREQIGDPSLPEIDENTTVEGTLDRRKRISGGTYKGKSKKPKVKLPTDADIQTKGNMKGQPKPEDIFGPDYEGGPTYLRSSIKNVLKYGLPVKSTYSGLAQVGMSGMKFLRLINQLN